MKRKIGKAAVTLIGLMIGLMIGWMIVMTTGAAFAQNQKAQPAQHESCDGALDVVPAKALSFVRKRRPDKSSVSATPAPPSQTTRKKTNR